MFKDDKGAVRPPSSTSAKQNTDVGSGSRPTGGRVAIPTSAPADPHTLGRAPPSWLK